MNRLTFQEIHPEDVLIDIRSLAQGRADYYKKSWHFNALNFQKNASRFLQSGVSIVFITDASSFELLGDFEAVVGTLNDVHVKGHITADKFPANWKESIQTISVEDFFDLDGDFTLLDLRHPDEITRPAPQINLVNIPLSDLVDGYHTLVTDKPIYRLCGSGIRATTAASFLLDKGYNVHVIDGGMKAMNEYLEKE